MHIMFRVIRATRRRTQNDDTLKEDIRKGKKNKLINCSFSYWRVRNRDKGILSGAMEITITRNQSGKNFKGCLWLLKVDLGNDEAGDKLFVTRSKGACPIYCRSFKRMDSFRCRGRAGVRIENLPNSIQFRGSVAPEDCLVDINLSLGKIHQRQSSKIIL